MKNILITGATGNLGALLIEKLKNFKIYAITNHDFYNENSKVKWIYADLLDAEKLFDALSEIPKIDIVIHLAAIIPNNNKDNLNYILNEKMTSNLLEVIKKYDVEKIIFSSSMTVYGRPLYLPVDKKHPLNPLDKYAKSKLNCEYLIKDFSEKNDVTSIIIRFPGLFGKRIKKGAIYNFFEKAKKNKDLELYLNDTPWDILCADDAVKIIYSIVKKPIKKNVICIPDYGERINILDISKRIISITDSKSKLNVKGTKTCDFYYSKDIFLEEIGVELPSLNEALIEFGKTI